MPRKRKPTPKAKAAPSRSRKPQRDYQNITGVPTRMRMVSDAIKALIVLRKGRWTVAELANEIGIGVRTTYRLIEALRAIGCTIEVSAEMENERGSPTMYYRIPAEALRKLLKL